MGGLDDHVAMIGDLVPPSPSPRAFFSSILGVDLGSRPAAEHTRESKSGTRDSEPEGYALSKYGDVKSSAQASNEAAMLSSFSHQKVSCSGGLLERIAARAGFNAPRLNTEGIRAAADLSQNQAVRSPYLTIPPGLSPTTLLDSPVFVSNSLVQPSPTTGKFPFPLSGDIQNSSLCREASDKSKKFSFDNNNLSTFAFKQVVPTGTYLFPGTLNKVPPSGSIHQSSLCVQSSIQSERSHVPPNVETAQVYPQNGTYQQHNSPPLDEDADEKGVGDSSSLGGSPAEDGYNWRKYGQKQVKGSEYPRSYYKCTHSNCTVKKKVERSLEGHITEIIYKGAHNHSKPSTKSLPAPTNGISDMQIESGTKQAGNGGDSDTCSWKNENLEVTTSAPLGSEYCSVVAQNGAQFESGEPVDMSSTFSNEEDDDDRGTHGSVSLRAYEGEGDESESKRRKLEIYPADMTGATRAIREPRVVVQTTSEVDILDDGYRWRKYGQKVVKGNPNPRSYYKCTSAGCNVRKHVERASHDLKSVITTYEGKHNHDVPAARNNSHVNSAVSNPPARTHFHSPDPSEHHGTVPRFEAPLSFGLPGRTQLASTPGFGFGMNPQGLSNMAMSGFPGLQINPYLGQQRPMNGMSSFMLPKGEPKVEPVSDHVLNLSNNSSAYQQVMSRLPLGPHM
ncbi:unnamed protein product [Cuscuta epithymum]|uniref:WRKY domain-containing protein n=1 Tax=Cuscuta epithymum TaxID=186058 RepID=A0AAV0FHR7_9ASTE|nr:unnamed protein product [Cuscuta epithymum]